MNFKPGKLKQKQRANIQNCKKKIKIKTLEKLKQSNTWNRDTTD